MMTTDIQLTDLTDSQRLVLDQQIYSLNLVYRANEAIDEKAMGILQLASLIGIILAFFATIEIRWLALFPLIIVLAAYALAPKKAFQPGTDDWDKLYSDYVHQDGGDCFDQVLSDYSETMTKSLAINEHKSRIVKSATFLFGIQVVGVAIGMIA